LRALVLIPISFFMIFLPLLKQSCNEPDWPAGLPHGEETLTNFDDQTSPGAYFDFSQGAILYGEEGKAQGDIYLERTQLAGNPALGVAFHDDLADSLLYKTTAPSLDWTLQPNPDTPARLPIYSGHCVWIKTGEGNYAKIKILATESNTDVSSFNYIRFEWIYQPNGSKEFTPNLEAEPASGTTN
jgi:hypothetical protein